MDQDNQLEVVGGKKVAKLSAASLTPEVLWQDFISKRIPVGCTMIWSIFALDMNFPIMRMPLRLKANVMEGVN